MSNGRGCHLFVRLCSFFSLFYLYINISARYISTHSLSMCVCVSYKIHQEPSHRLYSWWYGEEVIKRDSPPTLRPINSAFLHTYILDGRSSLCMRVYYIYSIYRRNIRYVYTCTVYMYMEERVRAAAAHPSAHTHTHRAEQSILMQHKAHSNNKCK
jgi:hypothetical protein